MNDNRIKYLNYFAILEFIFILNPVVFFCVVLCAPVTSASLFVSLKAPAPDLSVAGLQGAMGGFFQTAGGRGEASSSHGHIHQSQTATSRYLVKV